LRRSDTPDDLGDGETAGDAEEAVETIPGVIDYCRQRLTALSNRQVRLLVEFL
jgi:hypothetical protein